MSSLRLILFIAIPWRGKAFNLEPVKIREQLTAIGLSPNVKAYEEG
jgi:hypothetical protein